MLPGGLNWPLDLAVGHDGELYVADGTYFYALRGRRHACTPLGMLFTPGYPGFVRGLTPRPGQASSSSRRRAAQVARFRPADGESEFLADGFDQLYGVAVAPGGIVVVVEQGTGRLLSIRSGRDRGAGDRPGYPGRRGASDPTATVLVSESGAAGS